MTDHQDSNRGTIDLLLSHGYCLADDEHEREIMMPYPPLGLLYLSSHLKHRGFSVEVHDSTFSTIEEFQTCLDRLKPAVVGLYCTLMTKGAVLRMVKRCKAVGAMVVLGGPEPAPNATDYLRHGADVVVEGEGELTLEHLVPHLQTYGPKNLDGIRGISFLDADGNLVTTDSRPLIADISSQPWPDRKAIDMRAYIETWRRHHGHASVSLITSRGCPFTCAWCSHGVYGRSHRRRRPEEVADEIEWILEHYAPERLWYADDVFTLNRPWTLRLAAELRARGIVTPFECISRADRINEEVADALAAMGCARLWIGSESGSQRVLDRMARLTTVDDVQTKTAMLQARGIEVGMFIMLGYEGEEEVDLQATVEHLKRAAPDLVLTTVAYPIKGTEYYTEVAERLLAAGPWAKRTDRDLGVAGRHSRRYYHHVTRWMVNEYRLDRDSGRFPAGWGQRTRMRLASLWGRLGMWLSRNEREDTAFGSSGRGWAREETRERGRRS